MKIYTKTGDRGTTGLVGGQRVSKDSLRIHAIGEVDELNAMLGVCRTYAQNTPLDLELSNIQNWLFDLGAELATVGDARMQNERLSLQEINWLESSIDSYGEELEPLRNFILPGGSPLAAHLHLARSICRRAERTMTTLLNEEPIRSELFVLINRLSDWFFVTARIANRHSHVQDVKWNPRG